MDYFIGKFHLPVITKYDWNRYRGQKAKVASSARYFSMWILTKKVIMEIIDWIIYKVSLRNTLHIQSLKIITQILSWSCKISVKFFWYLELNFNRTCFIYFFKCVVLEWSPECEAKISRDTLKKHRCRWPSRKLLMITESLV